jgi:S-DNA-T family DNA segregation ATPase FtsK/SpoIIIE
MSPSEKNPTPSIDFIKLLENSSTIFFGMFKELYLGIRYNLIPWHLCLASSILTCSIFISGIDYQFFKWLYIEQAYPKDGLLSLFYWGVLISNGLWLWAFYKWAWRMRLSKKLEEIFCEAGLKSNRGRIPKLIYDKEIDEKARLLKVTIAGATLEKFKNAKPTIEANLKIYIDEIIERRSEGAIEIIYSPQAMPKMVKLENIKDIPPCKFLVGETRASVIKADIRKVPHLLVAGLTGSGKSTFLRQFIVTHYLNCKNANFILIDLKEGLEAHLFKDLPNVAVYSSVSEAVKRLSRVGYQIKERLNAIKKANCVDFDQYQNLPGNTPVLKREFILVDEAAELFLAGGDTKIGDVQLAKQVLSDIARRGRAAGIHLVIATQRPDSKSLDPQVKANLPGALCFQMANDASSITVLGVGKATDLPPVKGRAIWKEGAEMVELQTPFLQDTEAIKLLEPLRVTNKLNGQESTNET